MGDQRMGSCQTQVTLASPQVSKVVTAEIQIQLVGIKGIQQLHFIIPTTGVETIVTSTTNFVNIGVLIGSHLTWVMDWEGFQQKEI